MKRGLNAWNVDLWLMDPDGSNAHKVSDGGGWACWSPDSRWLYFSPPGQNGFRIEKASPAGGPNQIVREDGQKPAVDAGGKLFFVMSLPALNGLSEEEYGLVLEAERERTKRDVLSGKSAPLPVTRFTPKGAVGRFDEKTLPQ